MSKPLTALSNEPVLVFRGRSGDRNPRATAGAEVLGRTLATTLGIGTVFVGEPAPHIGAGFEVELNAARAGFIELQHALAQALSEGPTLVALPRCAAALATLPAVAAARPDACIVWFDAHGDSNLPSQTTTGYLGGMVLTGAAGLWDTGLGGTLTLSQVILVGARDLDACEQQLVDDGKLTLVAAGADLAERLRRAVAGRACYVHLDCDVLEPGLVATEYQVPEGLTFTDLNAACAVIAEHEVVGLEIAEFEASFPDGRPSDPTALIEALDPLFKRLNRA